MRKGNWVKWGKLINEKKNWKKVGCVRRWLMK